MLQQYVGKVVLNRAISKKDGQFRRVLAIANDPSLAKEGSPEVAYLTMSGTNGTRWDMVLNGDDCCVSMWRYRMEVRIVRDGKVFVVYDGIYSD